jgi:hypothetical protein
MDAIAYRAADSTMTSTAVNESVVPGKRDTLKMRTEMRSVDSTVVATEREIHVTSMAIPICGGIGVGVASSAKKAMPKTV